DLGRRDRFGLMRRDWRQVLAVCGLFLWGANALAAPQEGAKERRTAAREPVRLTIELGWKIPRAGLSQDQDAFGRPGLEVVPELTLEVSEGRVIQALAWPGGEASNPDRSYSFGPDPRGGWRLGTQPEGRVRARIEAPPDASLIVRAGDQVVSVPIVTILERP